MRIIPIACLADNYAYIININNSNTIGVVDPSESEPIISFLENMLSYILQDYPSHP